MSGVQCGPGNVNMEKTFFMYLFVTWELMLGRCCHWCSVLPLPYARGHKVKIRRESRVEVYHGDEAEPRAACTLQFSSVTQSCPTPWTPWTAAHQTSLSITNSQSLLRLMFIELVISIIQPSHPLSSPSPPAFNLSYHQGLFQWVSSLHQVAKVLEFQLQHQSFQWIFRTDFP